MSNMHPRLRLFKTKPEAIAKLQARTQGSFAILKQRADGQEGFGIDTSDPVPDDDPAAVDVVAASVFVEFANPDADNRPLTTRLGTIRDGIGTAALTQADLAKLEDDPRVALVEPGQPLATPNPVSLSATSEAPTAKRPASVPAADDTGAGVILGIIDVGGFDFSHKDFLDDDGKTRFIRIWDQGGSIRSSPAAFKYGAEFTGEHLNHAIANAGNFGVPAYELQPQSAMSRGSHGTHVASIAGGNLGVCPEALLAGVLIDLPKEDEDRRKSFYDSTRVKDAVDYLLQLADAMKLPISINISLGTNGHAHDASSAASRWIDSALAGPGRSICVAAGNSGQEGPTADGGIGWIMGRIHSSGQLQPTDGSVASEDAETVELEWNVVGNGLIDLSPNELEIWYAAQDRFDVSVKPPGGDWTKAIAPGEFLADTTLPNETVLAVYNTTYYAANGANTIALYLSPGMTGIAPGVWKVQLRGRDVRDGRFHAWIERDDPRRLTKPDDPVQLWQFPSFFTEASNVDNSSVSSLACGHRIISVANLDPSDRTINPTSSQGPTRDGRHKPEVAAPGTKVVAAHGFGSKAKPWVPKSGTSMAAPYVAGVVAHMLKTQPLLTAAQIGGIIRRTANPLPGQGRQWLDDAGYGEIAADACIAEAAIARDSTQVNL